MILSFVINSYTGVSFVISVDYVLLEKYTQKKNLQCQPNSVSVLFKTKYFLWSFLPNDYLHGQWTQFVEFNLTQFQYYSKLNIFSGHFCPMIMHGQWTQFVEFNLTQFQYYSKLNIFSWSFMPNDYAWAMKTQFVEFNLTQFQYYSKLNIFSGHLCPMIMHGQWTQFVEFNLTQFQYYSKLNIFSGHLCPMIMHGQWNSICWIQPNSVSVLFQN